MFGYQIEFERPAWLLLLLLLPVAWYWGRFSLSALSRGRHALAFALRAAVITGIALALAEVNIVRRSDRLAVIYVLDDSLSISSEQTRAAIDYINRSRARYRDSKRGDVAGVIVFGRQPAVELPPLDDNLPLVAIESKVDDEATDLASALRLARACFPADVSKRVVVLSDGNENLDSAREEARALAASDIGIDVVPLLRADTGDVSIEKVSVPAEVRRGVPFEVRVVINNSHEPGEGAAVAGRLRVYRRIGGAEQLVTEQSITVEPGKRVYAFREELAASDFYTYDAEFLPDAAVDDATPQNNRATAFTQVLGQGRVLLIEDWESPGGFSDLVERLRAARIEVDVQPSNQLFASLGELQRYDTVVLANVPRTGGGSAESLSQFSDEQIDMLVRNTQQLGGGLVMLGGSNSFGAGGWTNTALEAAMPVDFQIKNAKVVPVGALVLVIDRSGSMDGEKINMSKAAAIAAMKTLGQRDYLGVLAFDGEFEWIAVVQPVGNGTRIAAQVSRLGPGGGTTMYPGMNEGYLAISRVDAAVKHMIVLTDGHTENASFTQLASKMRTRGITTTAVAVGADADTALLQSIATAGGGKFYHVLQPQAIPRIFMKEARRVARPLVYENESGIPPQRLSSHEVLEGIDGGLPPLTGYVMTTPKQNPLVEIPLVAPLPAPGSHPLLASWSFGLGRAVAFTSDLGQRWTSDWTEWPDYEKLATQIIRWSMRPTSGDGKLTLFAEARDGRLRAVVTALDQENAFLNFLALRGAAVGPDVQPLDLTFEQFAPGRYVAECPVEQSGNYFITVAPGHGLAPLRSGVNVPHSAEFRDHGGNMTLLASLAGQAPEHGTAGLMIPPANADTDAVREGNVFRRDLPPALARRPVWHAAVLVAACLFLCDVFFRRVAVSLAPLRLLAGRMGGLLAWRTAESTAESESLGRLRGQKEAIARQLDDRRAAVRFETPETPAALKEVFEPNEPSVHAPAAENAPLAAEQEAESYTERLLKVKRDVRK